MANIITKKESEALLLKIRRGDEIALETVKKMSDPPYAYNLRELIEFKDKEWLLSYLKFKLEEKMIFALSICRNILQDKDIINTHLDLWNESKSFNVSNSLLWNMLSFDELDVRYEREIKIFIDTNFDKWLEKALRWHSREDVDDEKIINHYQKKISQYPEKKAYLYLYIASKLIKDPTKMKKFIKYYRNMKNQIVREAISTILNSSES